MTKRKSKKEKLYNSIIVSYNNLENTIYEMENIIKKENFLKYIKSIYIFTSYKFVMKELRQLIIDKINKYKFNISKNLEKIREYIHICDFAIFEYNESLDDNQELCEVASSLFYMFMSYLSYLEELN